MNDSFLEDLDLIPKDKNEQNNSQLSNKHITTRKVLTNPINVQSKKNYNNTESKQEKIISSSIVPKIKIISRSGNHDPFSTTSTTESKPLSSTPKSNKKNQADDNLKPVDNQMKIDKLKKKSQNLKTSTKLQDNKSLKDRRRSANSESSNRYLDVSSLKENTRPSTDSSSSRESGSQIDLKKDYTRRSSDHNSKKNDVLEKTDPVILLSAIKELVSRYTEQETIKILRAVQDLHMNSQVNLIKHLMHQTDDLVKELNFHKNSDNIKSLINENERMREDNFILRARNEVLQKKIDEMSLIKEENISLKLKLKELQQ